MERIKIPTRKNYLVRDGHAHFGQVVSELGVYGVTLSFVACIYSLFSIIYVLWCVPYI